MTVFDYKFSVSCKRFVSEQLFLEIAFGCFMHLAGILWTAIILVIARPPE